MVNFNNGTKIMVNRCMELLNAKIVCAQTRHIAKRVPLSCAQPRTLDTKTLLKERQKADQYRESKRLSMWEQNNQQANDKKSENKRMDQLHYKYSQECQRTYNCTWSDFPDNVKPKYSKILSMMENEPTRRKPGCAPETAKPWDNVAKNFIKQWGANNKPMINRKWNGNPTEASTGNVNGKKML